MESPFLVFFLLLCYLSRFNAFQVPLISKVQSHLVPKMAFNFFSPSSSSSTKFPSNKKLCVITGTTSGLGKETAKKLLQLDDYFVVCAVRDVKKMDQVAEKEKFDKKKYSILELDLGSFASVKSFVNKLKQAKTRPIDRLVCNAAVYQPALPTVRSLSFSLNSRIHSFLLAEIYERWLRGANAN